MTVFAICLAVLLLVSPTCRAEWRPWKFGRSENREFKAAQAVARKVCRGLIKLSKMPGVIHEGAKPMTEANKQLCRSYNFHDPKYPIPSDEGKPRTEVPIPKDFYSDQNIHGWPYAG